jgi:hypothetical protein
MKKVQQKRLVINRMTVANLSNANGGAGSDTLTIGSTFTVCLTRIKGECLTSANTICVPQ